jgi:hypothetical protein
MTSAVATSLRIQISTSVRSVRTITALRNVKITLAPILVAVKVAIVSMRMDLLVMPLSEGTDPGY